MHFPILQSLEEAGPKWKLSSGVKLKEAFSALSSALKVLSHSQTAAELPVEGIVAALKLAESQLWPSSNLVQQLVQTLCSGLRETSSALEEQAKVSNKAALETLIQEQETGLADKIKVLLTLLCHFLMTSQVGCIGILNPASARQIGR